MKPGDGTVLALPLPLPCRDGSWAAQGPRWGLSLPLLPGVRTVPTVGFLLGRMASCGQGGVRLWRLRGGELRSCPVDLGEHRVLELTDLAFGQAQDSHTL